MRPGDRKRRWQQSHGISAVIFLTMGGCVIYGVDGSGGAILALFLFGMAYLDFRDAKLGWKLKYDLPARAYRDLRHPNPIRREIAREAIAATHKEAGNPERSRYAFEERERGE